MDTAVSKKEIVGAYEELRGVLDSILDKKTWFDDEGFSEHANHVIGRVKSLCPEIDDIDSYRIQQKPLPGRGTMIVEAVPTKAKLRSLIGRLKGTPEFKANVSRGKSQEIGHEPSNSENGSEATDDGTCQSEGRA